MSPTPQSPRCQKCGYNLHGIFRAKCPECGWRASRPVPVPWYQRGSIIPIVLLIVTHAVLYVYLVACSGPKDSNLALWLVHGGCLYVAQFCPFVSPIFPLLGILCHLLYGRITIACHRRGYGPAAAGAMTVVHYAAALVGYTQDGYYKTDFGNFVSNIAAHPIFSAIATVAFLLLNALLWGLACYGSNAGIDRVISRLRARRNQD